MELQKSAEPIRNPGDPHPSPVSSFVHSYGAEISSRLAQHPDQQVSSLQLLLKQRQWEHRVVLMLSQG